MSARRRYYPPLPRRRPSWCAMIAEQSAELGSLEAVFERRDQERAAKVALAEARHDQLREAVRRVAWRAVEHKRYRAWRAAPLQVPDWVDGQGWPEPDGTVVA
jgi:predicted aminopeptidase